jgi:CDP-diacylglycerol--glycerol-3-phosphate 3-phosphatidyltransferase
MVGPAFGRIFAWPYRAVLAGFARAGLHPWHLTLLSLAGNLAAGWLLLTGRRVVPAVVLALAGTLDVFDGGLARLRGTASSAGAFLDSTCDRVADVVVFGCLFWSLTGQGSDVAAAFALAALVTSFMVSDLRAEAEAEGLALTEGAVQRLERYVLLLLGLLIPGALLPVLVLLTVLGLVTAAQRGWLAWRRLG